MLFNNTYFNYSDVIPYAGEFTLLVGILVILLNFTFLGTANYSLLMEYSSKVSVYLLLLTLINLQTPLKGVLVILTILVILVSDLYFKQTKLGYFEYNTLVLLSLFGSLVTISANDFMVFYISLEIQALAFYIMATMKKSAVSSEAGLKYFIVGSFSSVILVFGISLIVLVTGQFNFESLHLFCLISLTDPFLATVLKAGAILIITALSIKLAIAPFHEWVADVYEGLMTPTALFFATVPKISNFFILSKLVNYVFYSLSGTIQPFLKIECALIFIIAPLIGVVQQIIKRLFAFSSVNHFGFILLGLALGTKTGIEASFFYLTFYIILTFGLWTTLILLTYVKDSRLYQLTRINEVSALVQSNPGLAFSFIIMLLSTGAVPPLAGFHAKISVFFALMECTGNSLLISLAIFSSLVSVYYYIRIIKVILLSTPTTTVSLPLANNPIGTYIIATITVFNIFSFLLFI